MKEVQEPPELPEPCLALGGSETFLKDGIIVYETISMSMFEIIKTFYPRVLCIKMWQVCVFLLDLHSGFL